MVDDIDTYYESKFEHKVRIILTALKAELKKNGYHRYLTDENCDRVMYNLIFRISR